MKIIKCWKAEGYCVSGKVFGDDRFEEGYGVTTSTVFRVDIEQEEGCTSLVKVTTRSGTQYELVDPLDGGQLNLLKKSTQAINAKVFVDGVQECGMSYLGVQTICEN